jgi:uncharacterized protein (TIGR00297 family)
MKRSPAELGVAFATLAIVIFVMIKADVPADLLAIAWSGALVFSLIAFVLRFLTLSGVVAAGGLGASLIALGGWAWAVPAMAFFVLSSLLSKLGRGRKAGAEAVSEKGSRRDVWQVLANGGVGWVVLLVHTLDPGPIWYWGFLGAFAAATADTWETEIGTLSSAKPRMVTTWKLVPRGTSGAVSWMGTLGGLVGAVVIWGVAVPLATGSYAMASMLGAVAIVGGGLVASLVDSVLGATLQARFRDPVTGRETERTEGGLLVRGWRWLRNDAVNGLCTLTGALLPMACFQAADFAS